MRRPEQPAAPTLNPSSQREWAYGAYYRAYVLQKDRSDVEPAARVLASLRDYLSEIRGSHPDDLEVQRLWRRTERLHGRTLIRLGDPAGRDVILGLVPVEAEKQQLFATVVGQEFVTDLCGDLSNVGMHDVAVALASELVEVSTSQSIRARRLGDLAAWRLQRAVTHRVAGIGAKAEADLTEARRTADAAVALWRELDGDGVGRSNALQWREARAVLASIAVEASAHGSADLEPAIRELHELLRQSLPVPRVETYLQVAFRIGRLGVAHVRLGDLDRGIAYLEHAWRSTGNACVRPWLAVDLAAALDVAAARRADGQRNRLRAFVTEAVRRLCPQRGPDDVVVRLLESYV